MDFTPGTALGATAGIDAFVRVRFAGYVFMYIHVYIHVCVYVCAQTRARAHTHTRTQGPVGAHER